MLQDNLFRIFNNISLMNIHPGHFCRILERNAMRLHEQAAAGGELAGHHTMESPAAINGCYFLIAGRREEDKPRFLPVQ
jgi:hypothetical protein